MPGKTPGGRDSGLYSGSIYTGSGSPSLLRERGARIVRLWQFSYTPRTQTQKKTGNPSTRAHGKRERERENSTAECRSYDFSFAESILCFPTSDANGNLIVVLGNFNIWCICPCREGGGVSDTLAISLPTSSTSIGKWLSPTE